jgi:hypothetical protein
MSGLNVHQLSILLSPAALGATAEEWKTAYGNSKIPLLDAHAERYRTAKGELGFHDGVNHRVAPEGLWVGEDHSVAFDLESGKFEGMDRLGKIRSLNGATPWLIGARITMLILGDREVIHRVFSFKKEQGQAIDVEPVRVGASPIVSWNIDVATRSEEAPSSILTKVQDMLFEAIHVEYENLSGTKYLIWKRKG